MRQSSAPQRRVTICLRCSPTSRNAFRSAASTTMPFRVDRRGIPGCRVLTQPRLDLEATRRRDVFEVDPAEAGGDALRRADDLVDVLGRRQIGKASTPPNVLEEHRLALHHRQCRLRGRCRPGPSTAEPSVTTATMLPFIVSVRALARSLAIAIEMRPRPGYRPSRGRHASSAAALATPRSCRRGAPGTSGRTRA